MEGLERVVFEPDSQIKKLLNSFPNPSYIWQKREDNFILIDYNDAAKKVTHDLIKTMLNQKAKHIHKDRPDIVASINECFDKQKPISSYTKYTMKTTGQEVYISIYYYYISPDLVIVHIKDLTKWNIAENELLQSKEKYEMLFELSPIPIILLDLNGKIIDYNQVTIDLFGYPKEELINKHFLSLPVYPSDILPILESRFTDLVKFNSVEHSEFPIYTKNGEKIWIFTKISIIKIENVTLIQAFILDITERREFEQKIERMLKIERFLSKLSSRFIGIENIDAAINKSLLEMGNLIQAERAYILLLNEEDSLEFYTQEWCLEGIPPQKINPIIIEPIKYPWAQEQYEQFGYIFVESKSKLPENAENVKNILTELNINSILLFPIIIKGELYGFIGFDNFKKFQEWQKEEIQLFRTSSEVIGNALERKWSEETLKGSHQLLAGIISSLIESICLVDYNFNIIWTNNVTNQLFGEQITNNKCYKIFFQRGKPCEDCIGIKTFSDGRIHEKEVEMKNIEGEKMTCWYTSSSAGSNINGETEYAVLIFRNITKNKAIEQSLIESQNSLRQLTEHLKEKVEERTRELKTSEESYKRILNDLDVGFYKGQFKGELLMHNSKVNEILGIDPTISLVGAKTMDFFINPRTLEQYYNALVTNGYVKDFQAKVRRPDGNIIDIKINSHLVRDTEGNPKEVEGTIILISEQE
ncbi:MAG: PAS domain S-box protein [Candidatus Hermodarchaeota archaeon]